MTTPILDLDFLIAQDSFAAHLREPAKQRPTIIGVAAILAVAAKCTRSGSSNPERVLTGSVDPRSVLELALVHRLASLLWRPRGASAIETGLFELQGGKTAC